MSGVPRPVLVLEDVEGFEHADNASQAGQQHHPHHSRHTTRTANHEVVAQSGLRSVDTSALLMSTNTSDGFQESERGGRATLYRPCGSGVRDRGRPQHEMDDLSTRLEGSDSGGVMATPASAFQSDRRSQQQPPQRREMMQLEDITRTSTTEGGKPGEADGFYPFIIYGSPRIGVQPEQCRTSAEAGNVREGDLLQSSRCPIGQVPPREGLSPDVGRDNLDVMPGEQDLSLGLQKDLDGAAGMVAQLHGRLAGASCWTKRLLDERNSTIEEVARLRAQILELSPAPSRPTSPTHAPFPPCCGDAEARTISSEKRCDEDSPAGGNETTTAGDDKGIVREADRSAPRESRSVQASELDLSLEPESGGSAARGEGTGAMGHARGVAEGPRVTVVGVTENRCPSPDFADEFADKLADRSSDGLSPADMSNKYFCLSSSSDSGSCGSRGVNGMAESENRRRKEIVAKPLAAEDRDSTSAMVAAGYADSVAEEEDKGVRTVHPRPRLETSPNTDTPGDDDALGGSLTSAMKGPLCRGPSVGVADEDQAPSNASSKSAAGVTQNDAATFGTLSGHSVDATRFTSEQDDALCVVKDATNRFARKVAPGVNIRSGVPPFTGITVRSDDSSGNSSVDRSRQDGALRLMRATTSEAGGPVRESRTEFGARSRDELEISAYSERLVDVSFDKRPNLLGVMGMGGTGGVLRRHEDYLEESLRSIMKLPSYREPQDVVAGKEQHSMGATVTWADTTDINNQRASGGTSVRSAAKLTYRGDPFDDNRNGEHKSSEGFSSGIAGDQVGRKLAPNSEARYDSPGNSLKRATMRRRDDEPGGHVRMAYVGDQKIQPMMMQGDFCGSGATGVKRTVQSPADQATQTDSEEIREIARLTEDGDVPADATTRTGEAKLPATTGKPSTNLESVAIRKPREMNKPTETREAAEWEKTIPTGVFPSKRSQKVTRPKSDDTGRGYRKDCVDTGGRHHSCSASTSRIPPSKIERGKKCRSRSNSPTSRRAGHTEHGAADVGQMMKQDGTKEEVEGTNEAADTKVAAEGEKKKHEHPATADINGSVPTNSKASATTTPADRKESGGKIADRTIDNIVVSTRETPDPAEAESMLTILSALSLEVKRRRRRQKTRRAGDGGGTDGVGGGGGGSGGRIMYASIGERGEDSKGEEGARLLQERVSALEAAVMSSRTVLQNDPPEESIGPDLPQVQANDRLPTPTKPPSTTNPTTPTAATTLKPQSPQPQAHCQRCTVLYETTVILREQLKLSEHLLERSEHLRIAVDGRLAALLGNTAYTAAIAAAAATVAAADVPVFGAPAAEALSPVNSGGTTRVDGRSQDGGGIPGIVPGDKARDCSGGEVGVVRAVPAVSSEGEGTRGTRGDSFEAETIAHKDKDDGCKELGTDCGGRSGENVKEELLAATEAVWRIAEMAREVLEGELDRRGEALATARRVAKEAGEACSKQLQELSSARTALRIQEIEIAKSRAEADKAVTKEKETRRALEAARVAAGDAIRRADKETKALRADVGSLRDESASLRARLACVQGRREAEQQQANRTIEYLEHTVANFEGTLTHRRTQRQSHSSGHDPENGRATTGEESAREHSMNRSEDYLEGFIRETPPERQKSISNNGEYLLNHGQDQERQIRPNGITTRTTHAGGANVLEDAGSNQETESFQTVPDFAGSSLPDFAATRGRVGAIGGNNSGWERSDSVRSARWGPHDEDEMDEEGMKANHSRGRDASISSSLAPSSPRKESLGGGKPARFLVSGGRKFSSSSTSRHNPNSRKWSTSSSKSRKLSASSDVTEGSGAYPAQASRRDSRKFSTSSSTIARDDFSDTRENSGRRVGSRRVSGFSGHGTDPGRSPEKNNAECEDVTAKRERVARQADLERVLRRASESYPSPHLRDQSTAQNCQPMHVAEGDNDNDNRFPEHAGNGPIRGSIVEHDDRSNSNSRNGGSSRSGGKKYVEGATLHRASDDTVVGTRRDPAGEKDPTGKKDPSGEKDPAGGKDRHSVNKSATSTNGRSSSRGNNGGSTADITEQTLTKSASIAQAARPFPSSGPTAPHLPPDGGWRNALMTALGVKGYSAKRGSSVSSGGAAEFFVKSRTPERQAAHDDGDSSVVGESRGRARAENKVNDHGRQDMELHGISETSSGGRVDDGDVGRTDGCSGISVGHGCGARSGESPQHQPQQPLPQQPPKQQPQQPKRLQKEVDENVDQNCTEGPQGAAMPTAVAADLPVKDVTPDDDAQALECAVTPGQERQLTTPVIVVTRNDPDTRRANAVSHDMTVHPDRVPNSHPNPPTTSSLENGSAAGGGGGRGLAGQGLEEGREVDVGKPDVWKSGVDGELSEEEIDRALGGLTETEAMSFLIESGVPDDEGRKLHLDDVVKWLTRRRRKS